LAEGLVLRVDGFDVAGWTSIQVTRSIEQLADTFDLAISTSQIGAADLHEDQACEILFDGETILTGYIDDVDAGDTATSSTLSVHGRSRAGDLVDCSAIHKPWRNTPGLQIAQELCEPFGIDVAVETVEPLPTEKYFKIAEGASVFDALDRIARLHGCRVVSYPDGSIRFTRTRTGLLRYPDVVIARGVNVVSAHVKRSSSERFSTYVFKAQLAADDETFGEAAAAVKYEVTDEGVSRHRPLVIHTDGQKGGAALKEAAEWERATRAGRALQLEYEVANPGGMAQSWGHAHGIWEPNTVVVVRDPRWNVDGEFLVTSVTLVRDASGTRTQLALTWPEAFDIKKPPTKRKKGKRSW
jgi:prophage tail gpP-like protein